MVTNAGYMQMGSQPVAGRARAVPACASAWSSKPAAAHLFIDVAHTDRTARRPRGSS